jgi:thioredoxin reductase
VVDAGDPRNTPADHVHNFLTRDGTPPAELYAAGRAEVTRYGEYDQLKAHGITVTEGLVTEIEADASGLTGVRLAGGRHVELDAVVVAPRMQARAELLAPLGLKPAEMKIGEHAVGTYIEADPTGATAVPGVWVAGNLANVQAQVITSAAAGLAAGAAINLDLVLEEARV